MSNKQGFTSWILSAERDWLGVAYVTLYKGAPKLVEHQVSCTFGKDTVLLWSMRPRPKTDRAAA